MEGRSAHKEATLPHPVFPISLLGWSRHPWRYTPTSRKNGNVCHPADDGAARNVLLQPRQSGRPPKTSCSTAHDPTCSNPAWQERAISSKARSTLFISLPVVPDAAANARLTTCASRQEIAGIRTTPNGFLIKSGWTGTRPEIDCLERKPGPGLLIKRKQHARRRWQKRPVHDGIIRAPTVEEVPRSMPLLVGQIGFKSIGRTLVLFLSGLVPGHVDIPGFAEDSQDYAAFSRLARGHSPFGQTLGLICTPRPYGVGTSVDRSPSAFNSAHRAGGIGCSSIETLSVTCSGARAPGMMAETSGWASKNWSAAAGRGVS